MKSRSSKRSGGLEHPTDASIVRVVQLPLLNRAVPFTGETEVEKRRGIYPSGFAEKELATLAINASLNCEVKCVYCSSDSVLGPLASYREEVGDWWSCETAVHYGNIVDNVLRDAARMGARTDEVVFSSTVDPYQARLVSKNVPRQILEALAPTKLRLRLLSKLPRAAADLPFIAEHFGERATVGTSIPLLDHRIGRILEPGAPPPSVRAGMILGRARQLRLRRYVMACPILPGLYSDYSGFADAWSDVVDRYDPEKIWFEPINARGKNIAQVEAALEANQVSGMLDRMRAIGSREGWSAYNAELLGWVQRFARERFEVSRVRYLLYSRALTAEAKAAILRDDVTVLWQGGRRP